MSLTCMYVLFMLPKVQPYSQRYNLDAFLCYLRDYPCQIIVDPLQFSYFLVCSFVKAGIAVVKYGAY